MPSSREHRPDRETTPPSAHGAAEPFLRGGQGRVDGNCDRDGEPKPPAVRVGFAAVGDCKPGAV